MNTISIELAVYITCEKHFMEVIVLKNRVNGFKFVFHFIFCCIIVPCVGWKVRIDDKEHLVVHFQKKCLYTVIIGKNIDNFLF